MAKWDPAPTDQELLEGNAADRRRAARHEEWLTSFLQNHPEFSIYWLGVICTVYLGWQIWPSLTGPAPGRWVTIAFLGPLMLMLVAIVHLTAKLTKATHRYELQRQEKEAREAEEAEEREAQEALDELKAKLNAAKQAREQPQHDVLDCPGPQSKVRPRYDRQGELIEVAWVCPTCQLRWVHRGLWTAP